MAQKKDVVTGKWMYYGSYVNNENKRTQYKKRGFASKKEAKKAEELYRGEIENIDLHITFEEVANEYIVYSKKLVKESTVISNKVVLGKICENIGTYKMKELSDKILQEYIDKADSLYSGTYVSKIYYNINKVLRYAIEHDYIRNNPLTKVKRDARKNEIKEDMLFWEPVQFSLFIENVDSQLYKVLFSFLYYMGCRRGEVLALQWNDVDFKNKTVRINKAVSASLKNKITTPKTKNSFRTITMPDKLVILLKKWKKHNENLYAFNKNMFIFGYNRVIPPESLRENFKNYINITNEKLSDDDKIPNIRIHDLRHSHASYLINNMSAGFTDFDIAKRLGDTVSTLHNTYAHWFKSADKNIINFMDKDIS